ncbi:MAG: AzlC family ABC transporter permease [Gammaproteobacteria bacterium]
MHAGRDHWRDGVRAAIGAAPTFFSVFLSFGIAAQVSDAPLWAALALTLVVFASPAQFAMLDAANALQMIVAGVVVNLRFFMMSLSLSHLFGRRSRRELLVSAHFVAATSYLLTFFAARKRPGLATHAYYRGVVAVAFPASVVGTLLGFAVGATLPPLVAFGATLFLPIYFALLLANDLRGRYEVGAALAGFIATPMAEYVLPGWGMFVAALGVGALVTAVER